MIPGPWERRRAERFAQLLDEAEGALRHHARSAYDEELTGLVAVADAGRQQLSTVAERVTVDSAYRHRLRQRLIAVAQTQGIGATGDPGLSPEPAEELVAPRRRYKVAVAVGAVAGVLALSGVSTASGDAIPGDALYPVKRQTERAQLALAGSDLNRGQLHLGFAGTRLAEAAAVAPDAAALQAALDDMDADTREGVRLLHTAAVERQDAEVIMIVDSFVADQRRRVVDLVTRLQGEPRTRALGSLELLDRAADRAADLRQTLLCTGEGGFSFDSLGPLPERCSALSVPERYSAAPGTSDGSGKASRDGRTTGAPGTSGTPGDPSPSGLLPLDPESPAEDPDTPTRSPSAGILDELGRIIGDLLG